MNHKIYCPFIRGQGGAITSPGVDQMAESATQLGIESEVFNYGDYEAIAAKIDAKHIHGYKIAGLGYSLGCSTLTYLQTFKDFDLVLCIAASTFGENYAIKPSTKRSVLWRNLAEPLSAAGGDLGFTLIHEVAEPHLLMDTAKEVQAGVLAELKAMMGTGT